MEQKENFRIKEINSQTNYTQNPIPMKNGGLISLFSKKNIPKTIAVLLIILLLIAIGAIIWGRSSFSRAKIEINIKTPSDIASGEEVVFTIEYKNNNRVNLSETYLIIDYPSGVFSPDGKEIYQEQRDLKTVFKKSQGQEDFRVRFVGEKGETKNINARLEYKPQNINSRFDNSTSARIEINSVLIDIKIEGSENVMPGQPAGYSIRYENKTNKDIPNLRIELNYSEDYKVTNFEPKPIEGTTNIWQITTLKAGEEKRISLNGTLNGEEGEDKILRVTISKIENDELLQYSRSEYSTKIASSPLLLYIRLEGADENCNVDPGENLNYRIEFKNNTDVALQGLILKAHLEDSVFDFRKIELGREGFFDSRQNTITWSGGDIPELKLLDTNQSGGVSFSIMLKEPIPMSSYATKNFQAKITAEIGTLTVPTKFAVSELKIGKDFNCKINSTLDIGSKVYYYESSPGIFNTGPMPPKVDKITTYTVHWQITAGTNDIDNLRINAVLPQGINWSNYYINKVSNSQVYYNERTKEVVWEIQKVAAGTGYILPIYELIFQVGLQPSINQVGETPTLINETQIEGKDNFTGIILKDTSIEVTTMLPDDSRAKGMGQVVE